MKQTNIHMQFRHGPFDIGSYFQVNFVPALLDINLHQIVYLYKFLLCSEQIDFSAHTFYAIKKLGATSVKLHVMREDLKGKKGLFHCTIRGLFELILLR